MPYLAFDLAAMEKAPNVARAARITEDAAIAGMARMWKHCWHERTDVVDATAIEGFFGADATRALVTFHFLEPIADGFRVRGATRYLRIRQSRSEGGKKAAGNLIPGAVHRQREAEAAAEEGLGLQPKRSPTSASALTPSTEHRTPNIKKAAAAQPPATAIAGLVRLEEARAAYFGGIPSVPSGMEQAWSALLQGHEGDEDWVMQTYQHAWTDPWMASRRPPGALRAFLMPEQWPKHVLPKVAPPEPCTDCGAPTPPGSGAQWWAGWLCYPCAGKRNVTDDNGLQQNARGA